MIVGMLPMAFGLGEGGEQNAPLGRAVIGGLTLATLGTLFFVAQPRSRVIRREGPPRKLSAPLVFVVAVAALFALGYVPKHRQRQQLLAESERALTEPPVVRVVRPKPGGAERKLVLPGAVLALERIAVHSRADGFVARWLADMGDRVEAGQLLAELDTPELEREISSGQAALLKRLEQLKAFARIASPFAGRVAQRNVERGTLVSAGTGTPLFEVVATDPVRVLVQMPQSRVRDLALELAAKVLVDEYPGETFAGTLTRTSGTLDPSSRTMAADISVPNADGRLVPGMYANVELELPSAREGGLLLPATALVTRSEGVVVASVDGDGHVRLTPVQIERDRGVEVELRGGLAGGEDVIAVPPPGLRGGEPVRIAR